MYIMTRLNRLRRWLIFRPKRDFSWWTLTNQRSGKYFESISDSLHHKVDYNDTICIPYLGRLGKFKTVLNWETLLELSTILLQEKWVFIRIVIQFIQLVNILNWWFLNYCLKFRLFGVGFEFQFAKIITINHALNKINLSYCRNWIRYEI